MGRATEKKNPFFVSDEEDSDSDASMEDEEEEDPSGDEETPDIYRNSALGM